MTFKAGGYYDGDWQADYQHGYGKRLFNNNESYEGHFVNGIIHGQGQYTYSNGEFYEGSWDSGRKQG